MNQNCYSGNQGTMRMMRGSYARNAQSSCTSAQSGQQRNLSSEIPTENRRQLLNFIDEVSFTVYETLLYLDTHPTDQEAIGFFDKYNRLREHALKEYARLYGPLTISAANDRESQSWEWMNQPWPWEGGNC